jgi:hypothetical protein
VRAGVHDDGSARGPGWVAIMHGDGWTEPVKDEVQAELVKMKSKETNTGAVTRHRHLPCHWR